MTRIHVNQGVNPQWVVQGKVRGGRKWQSIGLYGNRDEAFKLAARALARASHRRVRILHTADYYEPIQVAWMEIP